MSEPIDAAVRDLVLALHRLIGRIKRLPPPAALSSLNLTPRHLSLLSMLLLDGRLTVTELAERLSIAPTTVSLLVGELSSKGVLRRLPDPDDRRRRIVDLDDDVRSDVSRWLAPGIRAWREALDPLSSSERSLVVHTVLAYEAAVTTALHGNQLSDTGSGPG